MSKFEFLEKLRDALSGQVPANVVKENLQYYDSYIKDEVRKGKKEAEIIVEIGDPRLIAKSIIGATPGAGDGEFEHYTGHTEKEKKSKSGIHYFDLSKWYWKLFGMLLLVLILAVVMMVVTGVLSLLVSMLPVIVIVALGMWILKNVK